MGLAPVGANFPRRFCGALQLLGTSIVVLLFSLTSMPVAIFL
jgi:hypothetical protein